jgi:predicted PurR-regulated permease PerM
VSVSSIDRVSAPASRPPQIQIPRWIQLVGLPLLIVGAFLVARAAGHAVFLFIVAALVALLVDPIVRALAAFRVRRGIGVALVYITFAAAIVVILIAIGTVVVGQTRTAANRFNDYFTEPHGRSRETSADRDVDRLQHWLNTHHLRSVKVKTSGHRLVKRIRDRDVGKYTHRLVNFVEGAAISIGRALFDGVLILVVSIYMLLGMDRFSRFIDRRFPPHRGPPLVPRIEHALVAYVRGQVALSLIIGTSAGLGLYVFGLVGLLPNAETYALVFGAWVAVTEVLPYLGPWLGAIPPTIYALVVHPISAVWVVLLFVGIHQIEGHIVVPNVMAGALRLHPLLVIFGLLAGIEMHGITGALVALPLLAAARATWEFFSERLALEPWGGKPLPVEVEVDPAEPESPPARTLSL